MVPEAARKNNNLKQLMLANCPLEDTEELLVSKWIQIKENNNNQLGKPKTKNIKVSKQVIEAEDDEEKEKA